MTMADGKTMAVMKKFVIIANPEKILPKKKKNQMMNKFKMKLNKTKNFCSDQT